MIPILRLNQAPDRERVETLLARLKLSADEVALGAGDRVKYVWYAGDHDFPPVARRAAVEWFRRWLVE